MTIFNCHFKSCSLLVIFSVVQWIQFICIVNCPAEPLVTCFTNESESKLGLCIGIQKQLKYCQPLYKIFRQNKWNEIRAQFCHPVERKSIKVCCPLDQLNEISEQETEMEFDFTTHQNYKLLPISDCGTTYSSTSDLIIGGLSAKPGEFPFIAKLFFVTKGQVGHRFTCGGTLISHRYILTAAHCFINVDEKLSIIRLGENDDDVEEECVELCVGNECNSICSTVQDFTQDKIEEIIVHPNYTHQIGSTNDIALIRLSQDVNITSYFTRPICLPFLKEYNVVKTLDDLKLVDRRKKGQVVGFGITSNDKLVASSILKHVSVPFLPLVHCQLVHRGNVIDKTQLCAGGQKGKNACLGDSGSALIMPALSKIGSKGNFVLRQFQLGIVSYGGRRCGLENSPVVYTRVRSFLIWILDSIRP